MNSNRKIFYLLILMSFVLACSHTSQADLSHDEQATIDVFEQVSPSVVFIKNAALEWDWLSSNVHEIPQGAGSGFIWDDRGHIVTNYHVIEKADKVDIVLGDREPYPAKLVGVDPDHDLAVFKIDAPKKLLKSIIKGQSKGLRVGQKVLSIGNPFGLDYSLTTGVVSALGRSMVAITGRKIYDAIQTDAAINPGSSGGPLLNSSGELIGVSTAIYSPTGASAGIGFAIPVDTVNRIVPQLIKYGRVQRVGLGGILLADNMRDRLGVQGAMILEVQEGSAAQMAGLKGTHRNSIGAIVYGDVIIEIDGKPIKTNENLLEVLDPKNPGEEISIKFLRVGKEETTIATLQALGN